MRSDTDQRTIDIIHLFHLAKSLIESLKVLHHDLLTNCDHIHVSKVFSRVSYIDMVDKRDHLEKAIKIAEEKPDFLRPKI